MSGCAYFKFKSAIEFDSVQYDGVFISVGDLKRAIIEKKNLKDCDLSLFNAQSNEEYLDNAFRIPKNSSVVVRRVPSMRPKTMQGQQPAGSANGLLPLSSNTGAPQTTTVNAANGAVAPLRIFSANPSPASSTRAPPRQKAPPSYVHAPNAKDEFDEYDTQAPDAEEGDESAKIAAFVSSSASDWDRQKREATGYSGGRGRGGRGGGGRDGGGRGRGQGMPHSSYVCHRCKQGGHFIQDCPTNGDAEYDVQKRWQTPGIPMAYLEVNTSGRLLLPTGETVSMRPNSEAFDKAVGAVPSSAVEDDVPDHLQCSLCEGIYRDAVLILCCQKSFCDECVRTKLIAEGKCPHCGDTSVNADKLYPNRDLRNAVSAYQRSTQAASAVGNATIETAPSAAASAAPIPAGEVLELANASAKESTEMTKKESTEGIRAAEAVECVVRETDQKRSEGRAEDEKPCVDGTDNFTQKASNPSLTQSGQDPAVGSPQNSQGQSQQDVPEGKLCDKNAAENRPVGSDGSLDTETKEKSNGKSEQKSYNCLSCGGLGHSTANCKNRKDSESQDNRSNGHLKATGGRSMYGPPGTLPSASPRPGMPRYGAWPMMPGWLPPLGWGSGPMGTGPGPMSREEFEARKRDLLKRKQSASDDRSLRDEGTAKSGKSSLSDADGEQAEHKHRSSRRSKHSGKSHSPRDDRDDMRERHSTRPFRLASRTSRSPERGDGRDMRRSKHSSRRSPSSGRGGSDRHDDERQLSRRGEYLHTSSRDAQKEHKREIVWERLGAQSDDRQGDRPDEERKSRKRVHDRIEDSRADETREDDYEDRKQYGRSHEQDDDRRKREKSRRGDHSRGSDDFGEEDRHCTGEREEMDASMEEEDDHKDRKKEKKHKHKKKHHKSKKHKSKHEDAQQDMSDGSENDDMQDDDSRAVQEGAGGSSKTSVFARLGGVGGGGSQRSVVEPVVKKVVDSREGAGRKSALSRLGALFQKSISEVGQKEGRDGGNKKRRNRRS